MAKKIYVVTMENDEMDAVEIGYASNQQIADKMIEKVSSTDGFKSNTYNSYQATLDYMEINNEPICFEEDIISAPLTMKQMILATSDESTYVQGNIIVELDEIIGNGLEEFLDLLSERLVGNQCLMDVNYKVIDTLADGRLVLRVSGDTSEILELDDAMVEELKKNIFDAGPDDMEDFLGCELTFETDEDMMAEMDYVLSQMPDEEQLRFCRKYLHK